MTGTLTARQREVLRLTAAGYTSAHVAHQLGIHPRTVAHHLGDIYQLLGANDRAHAVALAIYHGHITLAQLAHIAAARDTREPRTTDQQQGAAA